jgi:arylsulfatase A-like enzyme
MTCQTSALEQTESAGSSARDAGLDRSGPLSLLVLSVWCGLVAGLLEVGTIILRKQTFDSNRLYGMSRHFIWLVPVTDVCVFLSLGIVLCVLVFAWPRTGRWLAERMLCALTLLPPLLIAFPQVYGFAWLIVALGISTRLVPVLERRLAGFRRIVKISLPLAAGVVLSLAASLWAGDWLKAGREASQPMLPRGSPNILFIVLDTVAADHLRLHGYHRPTSATIDQLASRGIRFNHAQATSSWTLPSHASMFTGRWPHELSAGWHTPLDGAVPTLAEFLGSRGYATAGFAANYWYCASDSGLGRGFTTYRDYIFPELTAFHLAVLVDRPVDGLQAAGQFVDERLGFPFLKQATQALWWRFKAERKPAEVVNQEFLDWLSRRPSPERPFFAFLNYFDAHYPYQLPTTGMHRFASKPRDDRENDLIQNWFPLDKRELSPDQIAFVRDSYDDCVAHLDEYLGRLIDELESRRVLDQTWVIIAADHGESFGEHAGVFCHGTSLYQTELHVPLVILPPTGARRNQVVAEPVSLRDLAATVVDLAGLEAGSPFPGESLARFWNGADAAKPANYAAPGRTLSEVVPNDPLLNPDQSRAPKPQWPLAALTEGDWAYIRREGDVHEELFHLRDDSQETHNIAADPTARPRLEQMRATLSRLTAGPLTPGRFPP